MYIGEVSKRTGASPKAIRLYEKLGLIPIPDRKGKYRYYKDSDVDLIKVIKESQRVGFKLSEMQALFNEDISCGVFPWDKAIVLAKEKMQSLNQEIKKLENLDTELKKLVTVLKKRQCDY